MKKLSILTFIILSAFGVYSQVTELKGLIIKKNLCQFANGGGYVVDKSFDISNSFVRITNTNILITGSIKETYKLSDKQVDTTNNKLVVHFYGEDEKNFYIIALKEDGKNISVGIFPFDNEYFTEYIVKLDN